MRGLTHKPYQVRVWEFLKWNSYRQMLKHVWAMTFLYQPSQDFLRPATFTAPVPAHTIVHPHTIRVASALFSAPDVRYGFKLNIISM